MKTPFNKVKFFISAVLFLAMAFGLAMPTQTVRAATTWNVPGDGSNICTIGNPSCSTIQGAVIAATADDTISVAAGTYNLTAAIIVDKSVTILGAQAGVDPRPSVGERSGAESILASSLTVFNIRASNVEVNGFKIESSINNDLLNIVQEVSEASTYDNVRVRYNIIYNTGYPTNKMNEAVKIRTGTNALVDYNYIYNIPSPGDGINFDRVTDGTIAYNELHNQGSENAAIYVYGSTNTSISGNLVDTTTQNEGIKLGAKGGADYLLTGGSITGNVVHHTKQDGIAVYTSNTLVEGNHVYNSTSENGAIYVAYAVSSVTITKNCVYNNILDTGKWGNPAGIMIGTAVSAATVTVNYNNIYGNTPNGVTNKATTGLLDAKNNWWGAATGPGPVGPGAGDLVSVNVDFTPFLTSLAAGTPCSPPLDTEGPVTSNVVASLNPVAVSIAVTLTANVNDSTTGGSNIASAEYNIDGGGFVAMTANDGTFDGVSEDVIVSFNAPATAGIYNLCVRGTDVHNNIGGPECTMLVVYDPSGGFVTGGGWITSPLGAYTLDPTLTGKATFGFVSKYQKGASVPTGNTEFQFKVAGLNFKSTSYEWLVVAGMKAQFKGVGTINGQGPYKFMLFADDGSPDKPDTFRIRIWEVGTDEIVVYDNGSQQSLGGGSIVIHK